MDRDTALGGQNHYHDDAVGVMDRLPNTPHAPQTPAEKTESDEYVIQTQFDLIVTPRTGESFTEAVGRALNVYKFESGMKVVGASHKSYIPTKE